MTPRAGACGLALVGRLAGGYAGADPDRVANGRELYLLWDFGDGPLWIGW
jgi:hypothetical protein